MKTDNNTSRKKNANDFTIIIPARMGSTRLANKMLLTLDGEPLVIKTAKNALRANAKSVIVATDHPAIMAACEQYGINVKQTASSHNSGSERIAELVTSMALADDEIIINLQGDEPLIAPELLNQLAEFMLNKQNAAVDCPYATIAHPIKQQDEIFSPQAVKVVLDHTGNALYFSRSAIPYYRDGFANKEQFTLPSQMPILRHIGIYAYTAKFLRQYIALPLTAIEQVEMLEQLRPLYYGYKLAVLTVNSIPVAGIDTQADLERVRAYIQNTKSKNEE